MIWVVEAQNYMSLCGRLFNNATVLQVRRWGPLHVNEGQYRIQHVMTRAQNNLKRENLTLNGSL